MEEGGQTDLGVTPSLADLDPKHHLGENVCYFCDSDKHGFEPLLDAENKMRDFQKRCAFKKQWKQRLTVFGLVCVFSIASVFLFQLTETSRRKCFSPLQGLQCGKEILRILRETRPMFTGVCDSTHQRSIKGKYKA